MSNLPVPMAVVPRLWPGETFVCLGGGPSLTKDDVDSVRGRARVIAINDAYRVAPWADVLYAADSRWWQAHKGVPSFAGLKYTITSSHNVPAKRSFPYEDVNVLRYAGPKGLWRKPDGLCTGMNSGYQAINLSVHLGASRILLLGYDMQPDTEGKTHWFGEHGKGLCRFTDYPKIRVQFRHLVDPLRELGIEVINCSRRTVLEWFPRMPLEQALQSREVAA